MTSDGSQRHRKKNVIVICVTFKKGYWYCVSVKDFIDCYDPAASAIHKWAWNTGETILIRENQILDEKSFTSHYVHRETHTYLPGIKSRPPGWKSSIKRNKPWKMPKIGRGVFTLAYSRVVFDVSKNEITFSPEDLTQLLSQSIPDVINCNGIFSHSHLAQLVQETYRYAWHNAGHSAWELICWP
jgi:hypothetical protein